MSEAKKCEKSLKVRKVFLNVGGKMFVTNHTTLRKSGYFSSLIGDEEYGKNAETAPFIDRNDEMFSLVLDCLRSECRLLRVPTRQLLYELDYFMVNVCNPYIEKCITELWEATEGLSSDSQELIMKNFDKSVSLISGHEGIFLHISRQSNSRLQVEIDGEILDFDKSRIV
jgi:hypothetical protein